jgi:hypothetical protein
MDIIHSEVRVYMHHSHPLILAAFTTIKHIQAQHVESLITWYARTAYSGCSYREKVERVQTMGTELALIRRFGYTRLLQRRFRASVIMSE